MNLAPGTKLAHYEVLAPLDQRGIAFIDLVGVFAELLCAELAPMFDTRWGHFPSQETSLWPDGSTNGWSGKNNPARPNESSPASVPGSVTEDP